MPEMYEIQKQLKSFMTKKDINLIARRYKKSSLYECKWDNSLSKSQFVKVNYYRSKYCTVFNMEPALAHTEQQAIKGPPKY